MNKLKAAIKVVFLAFFIIPIYILMFGPVFLILDWLYGKDEFVYGLRELIRKTDEALEYE